MITLFGSDLNENDSIILADQCMLALDGRNENKITKGKRAREREEASLYYYIIRIFFIQSRKIYNCTNGKLWLTLIIKPI